MKRRSEAELQPPLAWKPTLENVTADWRHLKPLLSELVSPCRHACPAGSRPEIFIDHVKRGKVQEAFLEIAKANPFPATTGRVCYRFCERECNRESLDRAVAIGHIERYIGDSALSEKYRLPKKKKGNEGKILVVGAGPAGLSFAYHMTLFGFDVTVIDERKKPGGLLLHVIPEYRLPARVIMGEIARLLDWGIRFAQKRVHISDLEKLQKEYDALLIATGAWKHSLSGELAPDGKNVLFAHQFLETVKTEPLDLSGRVVSVIGGGNSAVDSARVAWRLGAEVTVMYRRTESEMPAYEEEYEEAVREGINFVFRVAPHRVVRSEDGHVVGLVLRKTETLRIPGSRRGKVITLNGTEQFFPCDLVILATGGNPEWKNSDVPDSEKIAFAGDAAGDAERTVSHAIGSGREKALRLLIKWGLAKPERKTTPNAVARTEHLNTDYVVLSERVRAKSTPIRERANSFDEIVATLSAHEAERESERCLSCGVCNLCGNCVIFCPEGATAFEESGITIDYEHCKGCGICWTECPRGAMSYEEE